MPRQESPRLAISYGWLRGEDYWGDPMSTNMLLADALTHPYARSMSENAPPLGVSIGDQYILTSEPEGEWIDYPLALATYHGTEKGWFFVNAFRGLRVDVEDIGFVFFDGSRWILETETHGEDPIEGTRYDISLSVGYAPSPGETLLYLPLAVSLLLPADGEGSVASARNPPEHIVSFSIRRNGAEVGMLTFEPSSFTGTFTIPNAVVMGPSDRFEIVCPMSMPPGFGVFGATFRSTVIL